MALTDTAIRSAKPAQKAYKLSDGLGLHLRVTPEGSKLWRLRYWLHGKEGLYAIGEYPEIKLAEAREARDAARKLIKQGLNPSRERKAAKLRRANESATTFEAVARDLIAKKVRGQHWSDPTHYKNVRVLEKEIFPAIGYLPIKEITSQQLLSLIETIEKRPAPHIALLARQLCGQVYQHAILTLRADHDPTYILRSVVSPPQTEHHAPLSERDIPVLVQSLQRYGGSPVTVAALRILLLTFVRPGELRKAEWSHIDLEAARWEIPARNMKMRAPHIVPLSRQAVQILRDLQRLTGNRVYVLPNVRRPDSYMASTTLNNALANIGFKGRFSAHGFRATASTLLNEQDYDDDHIERQLAHMERNGARAAYNHAKHLQPRTEMMQNWADYLDQLVQQAGGNSGAMGLIPTA